MPCLRFPSASLAMAKTAFGTSPSLCAFPPTPPSGSSEIGACGPGRGRARAGLWGGSPQDPARSRAWWPPPRSRVGVGAGPRLPAYGTLGGRKTRDEEEEDGVQGEEGRKDQWKAST